MNISDVFDSRFVRAADLKGTDSTVTISRVVMESLGHGPDADSKPVVYFTDRKKALVLNRTNSAAIAKLYGSETEDWVGKSITLYPTETSFRGQQVPCVRVRNEAPPEGG